MIIDEIIPPIDLNQEGSYLDFNQIYINNTTFVEDMSANQWVSLKDEF